MKSFQDRQTRRHWTKTLQSKKDSILSAIRLKALLLMNTNKMSTISLPWASWWSTWSFLNLCNSSSLNSSYFVNNSLLFAFTVVSSFLIFAGLSLFALVKFVLEFRSRLWLVTQRAPRPRRDLYWLTIDGVHIQFDTFPIQQGRHFHFYLLSDLL